VKIGENPSRANRASPLLRVTEVAARVEALNAKFVERIVEKTGTFAGVEAIASQLLTNVGIAARIAEPSGAPRRRDAEGARSCLTVYAGLRATPFA
jgi:hypothetical protein